MIIIISWGFDVLILKNDHFIIKNTTLLFLILNFNEFWLKLKVSYKKKAVPQITKLKVA